MCDLDFSATYNFLLAIWSILCLAKRKFFLIKLTSWILSQKCVINSSMGDVINVELTEDLGDKVTVYTLGSVWGHLINMPMSEIWFLI